MASGVGTPTPGRAGRPLERLDAWLNDPAVPHWERPGPSARQQRNDVLGALVFMGVAVVAVTLVKSFGSPIEGGAPEATWRAYAAVVLVIAPLAMRRRFPLLTLVLASVLFVGLSYLSPEASIQLAFQSAYFAALYAAVAWAPDRRMLWIAMALVLLTMALWLVIAITTTSIVESVAEREPSGPVSPFTASVIHLALVNLAYFGGAILVGRSSWRAALQRHRVAAQAATIRDQAAELARRAVVDERLRIARELHDVVAHHVSVIGIQAGAARRVLASDPDAATSALRGVEESSRSAVGEMRSLLGVLRSETGTTRGAAGDRTPEPGLADLPDLVAVHRRGGLDVELVELDESRADLARVPAALALSVYRIVQEALANVERHSTAGRALVTLRTPAQPSPDGRLERWLEVEVVDDGRPRVGTAGGGYGLQGIRERVRLHGGDAEIGPRRATSGWRVRARFPLVGSTAAGTSGTPAAAGVPVGGTT